MSHPRAWLVAISLFVSALTFLPAASAAPASSPAAYVYIQIQGPAGAVYGFSASSTGQLHAIPGAPWKPAGLIVGSTATKFLSLGKDLLHSYGVASSGALQSQLSQEPVFEYTGSSCGDSTQGANGAVLDHSGKYIYVLIEGYSCAAYQSYIINGDGSFNFDGDTEKNLESSDVTNTVGLPSILGNESFAYSDFYYLDSGPSLIGFQRESSGTLELMQFKETDPTLNGYPAAARPDASPAGNYIVVQLYADDSTPMQLASYSVDSQGNLSTTNTAADMPTSSFSAPQTKFSPSGDMVAAYADGAITGGNSGIEIYKFNGAAPLTLYKTLLSGTPIDDVAWDSSNHMYAISNAEGKLYVFTVTTTSATEDNAWSIGSPFKMVVVSKGSVSGPATQFSAPLLGSGTTPGGQVTIDESGNTTVDVTGQAASQTYTLQFCPAVTNGVSKTPACFNITTVSTNSNGSGSATVHFPQSGDWAGEFSLNNASGNSVLTTGLDPSAKNETYFSTLLPETKTNGGAATQNKTQSPLSSGSVNESGGTAVFTVGGASPSSGYQIVETNGRFLNSSQSYVLSPGFTTDASGNGSASVNLATQGSEGGDMFNVEGGPGAGYIGGFSIP